MTEEIWVPHVYLMRCKVNERLRPVLNSLRGHPGLEDPDWLVDLRLALPHEDPDSLERLRSCPFVKVGSTYGERPGKRADSLRRLAPNETMTCLSIPIVGTSTITYIPGERSLEIALHKRWDYWRVDPNREFFWRGDEIIELENAYKDYSSLFRDWAV